MAFHVLRNRCAVKSLQKLKKLKANQRKKYIQSAPKVLIQSLSEIVSNLLEGRFPLTVKQKRKLQKHKKTLHEIYSKKLSIKKKRSIFSSQRGGALITGLLSAIPLLTSLISNITNR
jgi:hypothetical protein